MWSNIDASEEENCEIIWSRDSKWCKQLTEVIRRLPPPQNHVLDEWWCLGRCLDRHIATTWEAKGTDWGKPPETAIAPSPLNPSILTTSKNSYCLCDPIVCRLHHSVPQSINHEPPWCNLLRDSLMCKKWSQMMMMMNPEAHMSSGRRGNFKTKNHSADQYAQNCLKATDFRLLLPKKKSQNPTRPSGRPTTSAAKNN